MTYQEAIMLRRTFILLLAPISLLLLAWPQAESLTTASGLGAQERILVAIDAGGSLPDTTIYVLNPDGSGKARLFDFHSQPKDTRGGVWGLRVAGNAIYFHSDHANLYTPASRNLFRIPADGRWLDQITPGPHAGDWNQPCPCGRISGFVRQSNGQPWGAAPVYLSGVGSTNTTPDGSFRFDHVPIGPRWVVAYRPGNSNVYDAESLSVVAGTATNVQLVPDSTLRMNFEHPALLGSRIYYRFSSASIQWTTLDFAAPVEVYKTSGFCTGVPTVDGFDVAPTSGRLAILNYQQGCGVGDTAHRGLYLADKDGNHLQLLVDMLANYNWSDTGVPQGVYWSPDERRIAINAMYAGNPVIVVFDAASGAYLGGVSYPATWDTTYGLYLYGWSPDGGWLLYLVEVHQVAKPTQRALVKIRVNSDGSVDLDAIEQLLRDPNISGATWARLGPAPRQRRVYLPLVGRDW